MWNHGAGRSGGKNWDVVLLGGAMGSLFSLCQCIISPWLGGRKFGSALPEQMGERY